MSRAFVSEDAAAAEAAVLPERPVSAHPNLVTPAGLARIDASVERLAQALAATPADDPARPALARDLRYWKARRLGAQVMPVPSGDVAEVCFGCAVTIRDGVGRARTWRIVGEDEADPAQGTLGWTSPLAQGLLGGTAGEVVDFDGARPAVTIVKIGAPPG